jgi:hypothetical protein
MMISAQSAPPEMNFTYGQKGTRELGVAGSIQLPMTVNNPPEGFPGEMGGTTAALQPFFKFFLMKGLHADLRLLFQGTWVEENETQAKSEQTTTIVMPSVGYTLAILPRLQLDLSVQAGMLSYRVFDDSSGADILDTTISYGGSVTILSPISESAVFGTGLILNWTELNFGSEELSILQKIITLQISWYF